uniref:Superoxide dismutase [Cu-Zn] n=2 Tax=Angiostrongylus cantonensis TaxID=6313 RepID=A0A0K0DPA1_ANGCA
LDLTERRGVVTITGNVSGLPVGPHGFHVHEFGDLGNGCLAAGDHYNPFRVNHGGPKNSRHKRHVGDLGNIVTPATGPTVINIRDSLIAFTGIRGIVGRAFAIHANRDDLGTGGNEGSLTTGNAGARLACGIIGYIAQGNA